MRMIVPSGSSPGRVGTEVTMSASASSAGFGCAVSATGASHGEGSPIIRSSGLQLGWDATTAVGAVVAGTAAFGAVAALAAGAASDFVTSLAGEVAAGAESLVIVSS